jgi:hypothetical protein
MILVGVKWQIRSAISAMSELPSSIIGINVTGYPLICSDRCAGCV